MPNEDLRSPKSPCGSEPVRIFAVGPDRVHVYGTMDELRGASQPPPAPFEFFDALGRRLGPVFDQGWTLATLVPVGRGDPPAVKQQIVAALTGLRADLEQQPGVVPDELRDAVDALPELDVEDGADLDKWFQVLDGAIFGHNNASDDRGRRHNLVCHRVFRCPH